MDAFDSLFLRTLLGKLKADADERIAHLVAGRAISMEDYRGRVEAIRVLQSIEQIAEDVRKSLVVDPGPDSRVVRRAQR